METQDKETPSEPGQQPQQPQDKETPSEPGQQPQQPQDKETLSEPGQQPQQPQDKETPSEPGQQPQQPQQPQDKETPSELGQQPQQEELSQEEKRNAAKKELGKLIEEQCQASGRDMEEVAYQLNMNRTVATALKDGSLYDKTEKVFAHGYVMSYVKMLGLDKAYVLDLLNTIYAEGTEKDMESIDRTFMSDYEKETALQNQKRTLVRAAVPILLALLAFGAVIYWKVYLDVSLGQAISSGSEAEQLETQELNFTSAVDENIFHQTEEEQEEKEPAPEEERVTGFNNVEATATSTLEFTFTQECWLEVKDNQGSEIAWQLYGPGEQVILRGEPPFSVTIGNVQGVIMRYQGKEIKLPTNPTNNVARLSVPLSQ